MCAYTKGLCTHSLPVLALVFSFFSFLYCSIFPYLILPYLSFPSFPFLYFPFISLTFPSVPFLSLSFPSFTFLYFPYLPSLLFSSLLLSGKANYDELFAFDRTASRLMDMQSSEYLSAPVKVPRCVHCIQACSIQTCCIET